MTVKLKAIVRRTTGRRTTPAGKDLTIGEVESYVFALSPDPRVSKQGSVISIQSVLEYADPNLHQDKPITLLAGSPYVCYVFISGFAIFSPEFWSEGLIRPPMRQNVPTCASGDSEIELISDQPVYIFKIEVIHIPLRSRDRLISRKGFEILHSPSYSQKLKNLAWSFYGGYHLLHMLQVWLKEMKK